MKKIDYWGIFCVLAIALGFLCIIFRCSSAQIRPDIKEQIERTEAIADKSKSIIEQTKKTSAEIRMRGTPESQIEANYMETCADQLEDCTDNSLKISASLKAQAEEIDHQRKIIESMKFFYEFGKSSMWFLIGASAMTGFYLIGRFVLKLPFL